jgi:GTPase
LGDNTIQTQETRCGFVALVGRPNAGKSTLTNALLGEKIALVSHKANATRKRSQAIIMHGNTQIILVDTPGIHESEKRFNQFMLEETLKAISDSDLIVYLAPASDSLLHYEKFLKLIPQGTKHIVALNKIDQLSQAKLLAKIQNYNQYADKFEALIPLNALRLTGCKDLLDIISKNLGISPFLYDPEDITTLYIKEIYKEFIREAVFDFVSDEVPYESDVIIDKIEEKRGIEYIKATVIVEKESQKAIIIGNGGSTIKRIGKNARKKIEHLSGEKSYLDLFVSVKKGWRKDKKFLEEIGYI